MLPAGAQREELAERARLLRGALLWQMDAAYKVRLRRVTSRPARDRGAACGGAQPRAARWNSPGATAPRDTRAFASRSADSPSASSEIGPRIDAARAAQERVLADIAVTELEAQKRRLASYATQAQFALAALYDGATAGVVR